MKNERRIVSNECCVLSKERHPPRREQGVLSVNDLAIPAKLVFCHKE